MTMVVPDDIGHDEAVGLAISANEEAVRLAKSEQLYRAQVWSGIASSWAQLAAQMGIETVTELVDADEESPADPYDEETMFRIFKAIKKAVPGLSTAWCSDIINELQNSGILFRKSS